jgi:hypothetical protein
MSPWGTETRSSALISLVLGRAAWDNPRPVMLSFPLRATLADSRNVELASSLAPPRFVPSATPRTGSKEEDHMNRVSRIAPLCRRSVY